MEALAFVTETGPLSVQQLHNGTSVSAVPSVNYHGTNKVLYLLWGQLEVSVFGSVPQCQLPLLNDVCV